MAEKEMPKNPSSSRVLSRNNPSTMGSNYIVKKRKIHMVSSMAEKDMLKNPSSSRVLSRNNPSKISKMGSDYIDNKPKVQKVLRPIFCLKNRDEIKKVEKREDCFILEFDPYDDLKFSLCKDVDNADLHVVAEKGQVACRDYPHPRHTCAKYPFGKTPHDSHCEMCYCYVCDVSAPCSMWVGSGGHCHAFNNELWNFKRSVTRDVIRDVMKALKEMMMKNGLWVR